MSREVRAYGGHMERQAGLGRSLEEVLDSLTPVDADAANPGRVLFEPEDVEQQLDQLMNDVAALRERVQHLVGLVPDDAVLRALPVPPDPTGELSTGSKKKKKKKKKKSGKRAKG
jgi:hypothetical protein